MTHPFACYIDKGMMLLRNRFFKSCVFNTNLRKWFEDNNITELNQLNGYTNAKSIDDIKLVVTESSIKYLKFGTLDDWRKNIDSKFGVVKTDKPTHFFEGQMVQTSYQMINTLNLSEEEVSLLLEESFDYLKQIQQDKDVLRFHLFQRAKKHNNLIEIENEDEEDFYLEESYRDDVMLKLLKINDKFHLTKAYKQFRSNLLTSLRNKLYIGKILIDGTYATLFGNGYELLLETIKKFDHKNPTSLIKSSNIYCKFFDDNEELVCARSPHITMGNLYVVRNKNIFEYDKYFNLSKEIVCVNAIGENIQQRLNGCDYDSDTMLITNNKIILSNAKLHYERFLVPVFVGESSKKSGELWKVDYDIQKNMVGQIVNLSQIYNSIIWTKINNSNSNIAELYNKAAILAVMSGMEIDKAKRHYDISVECILEELNLEKRDLTNDFYPYFFQKISELNKKKYKNQQNNRQYASYKTAMDFVYNKVLNTTLSNENRTNDVPLYDIANRCEPSGGYSTIQAKRILEYAKETIESINIVRAEHGNNEYDDNVYQKKVRAILNRGLSKIHSELNNEYTIHLILKKLDTEEFSDCLWAILYFVLKKNPEMFEKVFKTEKINYKLIPSQSDFDLKLYSKKYKKHQ